MIEMDAVEVIKPHILYLGGLYRTLNVAAMAAEVDLP